jgi:hypothetical protein
MYLRRPCPHLTIDSEPERTRGADMTDPETVAPDFVAGTHDEVTRDLDLVTDEKFIGAGKASGHGVVSWVPVVDEELHMPERRPLRRRPVVALLDSGVQAHPLLSDDPDDPFYVDLDEVFPDADGMPPLASLAEDGRGTDFGSHWGHGTFIAGLIRLHAPDAQVLSVRVMTAHGGVNEARAVAALKRLARYRDHGGAVDVVLMAFGRKVGANSDPAATQAIKDAIKDLNRKGVRVVASAGNERTNVPTSPANLAVEPGFAVDSVGAVGPVDGHADFSNYGPWVTHWYEGTSVLSIMPLQVVGSEKAGGGLARWSGTSFAAPLRVADILHSGVREPDAGP